MKPLHAFCAFAALSTVFALPSELQNSPPHDVKPFRRRSLHYGMKRQATASTTTSPGTSSTKTSSSTTTTTTTTTTTSSKPSAVTTTAPVRSSTSSSTSTSTRSSSSTSSTSSSTSRTTSTTSTRSSTSSALSSTSSTLSSASSTLSSTSSTLSSTMTSTSATTSALPTLNLSPPSRYIFIAGDSYTSTGFNALGMTDLTTPSIDNPMGNPPYPGVTLSGYDNWVGGLLVNYSSPGTVGYNMAVGGCPVNATRLDFNQTNSLGNYADFIQQVSGVQGMTGLKWNQTNSLFINWFGINDINAAGLSNYRPWAESTAILKDDIGDYFGQMHRQYTMGARNMMVMLVPPLDRTPVWAKGDPTKAPMAKNLTKFWNDEVTSRMASFRSTHPGLKAVTFDTPSIFNNILDNYAAYGSPDNTCWNYPEGEPCLWHDFVHPGLTIQRALGKAVSEAIKAAGFFPST